MSFKPHKRTVVHPFIISSIYREVKQVFKGPVASRWRTYVQRVALTVRNESAASAARCAVGIRSSSTSALRGRPGLCTVLNRVPRGLCFGDRGPGRHRSPARMAEHAGRRWPWFRAFLDTVSALARGGITKAILTLPVSVSAACAGPRAQPSPWGGPGAVTSPTCQFPVPGAGTVLWACPGLLSQQETLIP